MLGGLAVGSPRVPTFRLGRREGTLLGSLQGRLPTGATWSREVLFQPFAALSTRQPAEGSVCQRRQSSRTCRGVPEVTVNQGLPPGAACVWKRQPNRRTKLLSYRSDSYAGLSTWCHRSLAEQIHELILCHPISVNVVRKRLKIELSILQVPFPGEARGSMFQQGI